MTVELRADVPVHAVTRALDPPPELLDALGPEGTAWIHDGAGFVTSGVLARIDPDGASSWLAAVEHDDEIGRPGTGPLAVGAMPFDPSRPAELLVPRRIVGRDADGRGWITELGPAAISTPTETGRSPTSFTVRERMTHDQWCRAVQAALEAIDRGELEKVVLARRVDVEADRPFRTRDLLQRLEADQPGCYLYAVDGMVGASPELLVRRTGSGIESRPMAGTAIGVDSHSLRALSRSTKDAREHRLVVDAIIETLAPCCDRLLVAADPEIARFASVAHLVTPVRGTLRRPAPDAVAIARALHPTPAVGGAPRARALATIRRLEPCDRERYAGPVGWVDAHGDGEWIVALRGARLEGTRASLHAGAGVVAGSVPEDEWRETEAKLEPMLRALLEQGPGMGVPLSAVPR